MDIRKIRELVRLMERSPLTELTYKEGDMEIRLGKTVSAPAAYPVSPAPAPASAPPPEEEDDTLLITAPIVGTFYSAPAPDLPAYVKVGDHVKKGQTVCILEAMKLMNEIDVDYDCEIAVRVIRACRDMGIGSVAVYSEEDKNSLHVQLADERVCIGAGPARNSYLNPDRIISAARNAGADAIHPGYGFLSENSQFARKCREYGLTFIGPDPEVIDRMGNKSQARKTMMDAGVPVIPGGREPVFDAPTALAMAREIGFPVMIKASSGGGGKGMRQAMNEEEFEFQFNLAQRESANAFGDDTMYLEKLIEEPRHVEVQIMADAFGNVVALGDRDCSVQRNHQKLIEESPSPAVDGETRQRMCDAAILAAKTVGYTNAGTIEFIVDRSGEFYFMEMNTRIQVEHGVTELVTGTDLVAEQLRVAAGEPLSFTQEDVRLRGHAIECRINAEIPEKNFMPSPGKITVLHLPGGNGVRVDTALYTGYIVPSDYDSMIAKILVHAPTRQAAIRKMRAALNETLIIGVETNLDFQFRIMHNQVFCEGKADTGFIEQFVGGGK